MMGYPDLNAWFYGLDLQALMRIMTWPKGCCDCNEFIDACDEAWSDMDEEQRYDLYLEYQDWF